MNSKDDIVKLSQFDFFFLACESVMTAMTQVITVRFKTKHSDSEIRDAIRYMLSIYPRLRSIVEPTLFSYQIRILNDHDKKVDILFKDAFKVRKNMQHNTEEYIDYRRSLYNEPFSLEQGLPIKIRYIPDDPQPVLLLSIHHMTCDGIAWEHLVESLISYLNGKPPSVVPLDNPSIWPAIIEKPFYKIPLQIYRSYKLFQENKKKTKNDIVIQASAKPVDYFSPVNMYQQILSHDASTLLSKSKELGCSLTVLLLTTFSAVFSKGPGKDKGNVVSIQLAVNLRPYFEKKQPVFGNYLLTSSIRAPQNSCNNTKNLLEKINNQLQKIIDQLKNKDLILNLLIDKLLTLMGKKLFARGARYAKKSGQLPITAYFSNLGNLNRLNSHGTKAQVCEAIASIPHYGLFITVSGLDEGINVNISYPEAEFTQNDIKNIVTALEEELGTLIQ